MSLSLADYLEKLFTPHYTVDSISANYLSQFQATAIAKGGTIQQYTGIYPQRKDRLRQLTKECMA